MLFRKRPNLHWKIVITIINIFYQTKFKIAAKYAKRRQEKTFYTAIQLQKCWNKPFNNEILKTFPKKYSIIVFFFFSNKNLI